MRCGDTFCSLGENGPSSGSSSRCLPKRSLHEKPSDVAADSPPRSLTREENTMKSILKQGLIAFVLALALAAFGFSVAAAQDRVEKVSNSGFADTVKKVETAIKERGAMIVATIDHQNMLRMVGASIRGSKTIEFGKPDMMKMLLPDNPEIGVEMPLKIYVYERADGKTVLSYRKLSSAFASYGKEPLANAGQMMDMMLAEIVAEAAK